MQWTYPRKIFLSILLLILIGSLLLYTPIAFNYQTYHYENNQYVFHLLPSKNFVYTQNKRILNFNFFNAIFMATSAFTNTGLTLLPIGDDLSFFGQFVIYVLIEIGGFGYASLFYLAAKWLRKITKKGVFSSAILNIEKGGTKITSSPFMIVKIFIIIFIIQLVFGFIFSLIFFFHPFYIQQSWNNLINNLQNKNFQIEFNIANQTKILHALELNNNTNNLFILSFDNINHEPFPTYQNYKQALWQGIFLSGSAINNAGFDLFGSFSVEMFRNDFGILIQVLLIFLFFVGGIGFPVIYYLSNLTSWFFKRYVAYHLFGKIQYYKQIKPKSTTFDRMCLVGFFLFNIITVIILYASEYSFVTTNNSFDILTTNHFTITNYPQTVTIRFLDNKKPNFQTITFFGQKPVTNRNFAIFFTALSSRSAGFATVKTQIFNEFSLFLITFYMFIGVAPSSTGGGVRITTIIILFKNCINWIKKAEKTIFWKRKISDKIIINAYVVVIMGLSFLFFCAAIMYLTTKTSYNLQNPWFITFFFEVASAFGTSGLSSGLTSMDLNWWSLLILIILMFVGQIGISSVLQIFSRKIPKQKFPNYLETNIKIG